MKTLKNIDERYISWSFRVRSSWIRCQNNEKIISNIDFLLFFSEKCNFYLPILFEVASLRLWLRMVLKSVPVWSLKLLLEICIVEKLFKSWFSIWRLWNTWPWVSQILWETNKNLAKNAFLWKKYIYKSI